MSHNRKPGSMPTHFRKSLKGYVSRIKRETRNIQLPSPSKSFSSSRNWVASACKHPKTLSFATNRPPKNERPPDIDDRDNSEAATLSDIDRFLHENFKSLYIEDNEDDTSKEFDVGDIEDTNHGQNVIFDSPTHLRGSHSFVVENAEAEFEAQEIRASKSSNESSSSNDAASNSETFESNECILAEQKGAVLPENCIVVLKYSPTPCQDFKRSMVEITKSRMVMQRHYKLDWDFMQELLISYLELNDKKFHKFILNAFVDLILALRHSNDTNSKWGSTSSRRLRFAREKTRHSARETS